MKNFLTKKSVMISLIVAAIVMFALTIIWCARPVSVGYTYKQDNSSIHFNSTNKCTMEMEDTKTKLWYFTKDGVLVLCGPAEDIKVAGTVVAKAMTKDEFKDYKKEILEDWDKEEAKENGIQINAFKIGEGDDVATCAGAIVTVVIFAILTITAATFATLSVVYYLNKQKG